METIGQPISTHPQASSLWTRRPPIVYVRYHTPLTGDGSKGWTAKEGILRLVIPEKFGETKERTPDYKSQYSLGPLDLAFPSPKLPSPASWIIQITNFGLTRTLKQVNLI